MARNYIHSFTILMIICIRWLGLSTVMDSKYPKKGFAIQLFDINYFSHTDYGLKDF